MARGIDYRQAIATALGGHGVDWRRTLAADAGVSDYRKAIADKAGMQPADWRRAAMQLSGKSSWQEGLANIADWWNA